MANLAKKLPKSKICSIENCSTKCYAKGFCPHHYHKANKYGDPLYEKPIPKKKTCSVEGCEKEHLAKGWCLMHYTRNRSYGSPFVVFIEKHGMADTSEYKSWCHMKERCYNKKYKRYSEWGGRGILVCERWKNSFMAFFEDMGFKPSKGYLIDRIDNDKGYSPDNCRWATITEQNRNKRLLKVNTSGFNGVYLRKNGKWRAAIGVNGNTINLGTFNTLSEAAKARKDAELKYW